MKNPPLLFHEIHASCFAALVSITNDLLRGKRMRYADILAALPNQDPSWQAEAEKLLHAVFLFDADGYARAFPSHPIRLAPTSAERQFLKTMLSDPRAQFLFPPQLREKLLPQLQDVDAPDLASVWSILQDRGDEVQKLSPVLSTIFLALRTRKMLFCRNLDRSGVLHEDLLAPCRLEYDAAQNRYRLIAWLEAEHRAIKINASSLQEVVIQNDAIPEDTESHFQSFLKRKQRFVTLSLTPKCNAVLRCFTLFAPYDKEAIYDDEQQLYTLKIKYYAFDEKEILQQILSLGAAVTVLSPERMRESVYETLCRALTHFADAQPGEC